MASCSTIVFVIAVGAAAMSSFSMTNARVVPAEPLSVTMDQYGNPILFLREKRTPVNPFPQRAMMFTGYYTPTRRSSNGGPATGVFAQGNSVSGGAYLGGLEPSYLKKGPEPISEPEISSAEAEAAPGPDGHHQEGQQIQSQEQDQPEYPIAAPEPSPYGTEAPIAAEEPIGPNTDVPAVPSRPKSPKKGKKTPFPVEEDDDEEDVEDDEELVLPFVPVKGGRRRNGYVPHLNNFFPMMFSFPGGTSRAGSSGSLPGAITAIANSYSTGKSGIASSVATAYGGSPNGKKQRRTSTDEE